MSDSTYDVAQYAHDLRQITSEETDHKKIVQRIRPLAQKLAATPGWLENAHRTCTSERGFGVHLLHEEDDHSNAVFLIAWLPDRGTLPHNHKTWAVVAGVEGEEQEIMFSRVDDGSKNG